MRPLIGFRIFAAGASIAAAAALLPTPTAAQQTDAEALALDSLLEIRISTAAKYAQRIGEVASSVTIVTSEDIERYGYRTLDEVFAAIPGFYTSNDRNYTYVGARGFSRPTDYNNRLLLLVDGNTVNETMWGAAPAGGELPIPLRSLERIEIVRGPGSALYGTGAIFGVVNLITRTPAAVDGVEVAAQGGSFGRRGGHLLVGRELAGDIGLSLATLWDRSDGGAHFYQEYDAPETQRGIARDRDWERRWSTQGAITRGDLRLHGRWGSRRKGYPTGAYETAFDDPSAATRDAYGFLELGYQRQIGAATQLATRAYYHRFEFEGTYPYVVDDEGAIDPWRVDGRQQSVGSEATLRWDLTSANRLTIGGELRRHAQAQYRYGVDNAYVPESGFDVPSTTTSAYVQDEHQLTSAVSILGGLRYDRYDAVLDAFSPRLAMIVAPTRGTTVKLLYGQAFRAPSIYEARIDGDGYIPSENLRPERARTLELVVQQRLTSGLLASASAFRYRIHELIDQVLVNPVVSGEVDATTELYQYRNVGSASSSGIELGLDARLGRAFSGYANYTYQRTVDDETDERLTNSPAHLFKAGLGATTSSWLRPAVQLRHESARRTVYDTYTSAFTVADLHLVFTPWRGAPAAADRQRIGGPELAIRLNNVFDASYATPGGIEHRQPAIAQDGRNLVAEVRYRL
jgi:iron complex outermembrane receptor protein